MAAAALQIEKPEQPQLAKHDSTILGRMNSTKIFLLKFNQKN
jgi:hypothetical protein